MKTLDKDYKNEMMYDKPSVEIKYTVNKQLEDQLDFIYKVTLNINRITTQISGESNTNGR